MLAFALPLVSRAIAGAVGLPLAPLTIAAILALTLGRALNPAPGGAAGAGLDPKSMMRLTPALNQRQGVLGPPEISADAFL
jgi:hypothetical protein